MKLTIHTPVGKIISESEKQVVLPSYITSFDNSRPLLNIDEEEASVLIDGGKTDVSDLIDKYSFYLQYDYSLYLNSNYRKEIDARLIANNGAVADSEAILQTLLSWARQKGQEQNHYDEILKESIKSLAPETLLDAMLFRALASATDKGCTITQDGQLTGASKKKFFKFFTGLIHRAYYALKDWNTRHKSADDNTELLLIVDLLRPFANLTVNSFVFENRLILRNTIYVLYTMEMLQYEHRSTLYNIMYIVDKFRTQDESLYLNYSSPWIQKAEKYEQGKMYTFKLGFFGSDRYIFELTGSELMSLKTARMNDSVIMTDIRNSLTDIEEQYLATVDVSGKTNKDVINSICATEMTNIYGFEGPDSWNKYFRKSLKDISTAAQSSSNKAMPQDCYCQVLYIVYLKLINTNIPFWNFDETTITELFDLLRINPSDDQGDFYKSFYKLNTIKSHCIAENMSKEIESDTNADKDTDIVWEHINVESATPEEMIKRVIAFIKPLIKEIDPTTNSGFLILPTESEIRHYSNLIGSKDEFLDRFKNLLNTEPIRSSMMKNHPGKFHCGFNAKLLCNILGVLKNKDTKNDMNICYLGNSDFEMQNALFIRRKVGTKSYKNYIKRYDEYINLDGSSKSNSVLTMDMKKSIFRIFRSPKTHY